MSKTLTIVLSFAMGAWAVAGALGILPALMSFMVFDAPGSANELIPNITFVTLASFPLVCLASIFIVSVSMQLNSWRSAIAAALLPCINIISFALLYYFDK